LEADAKASTEGPAAGSSQSQGTLSDQAGRYRPGDLEGPGAGVVIDPFLNQDTAGCV
jgi:hypothetical protein